MRKERMIPSIIAVIATYVIAGAILVLGVGHLTKSAVAAAAILAVYGALFLVMAFNCALAKPQPSRISKRIR